MIRIGSRGHDYPSYDVRVVSFSRDLTTLYAPPPGLLGDPWPSPQLVYLGLYLSQLGCKSVLIESHYIDRDYLLDLTLYYSRSLRSYPNYCYRLHFFKEEFGQERWLEILRHANHGQRSAENAFLQSSYLG